MISPFRRGSTRGPRHPSSEEELTKKQARGRMYEEPTEDNLEKSKLLV